MEMDQIAAEVAIAGNYSQEYGEIHNPGWQRQRNLDLEAAILLCSIVLFQLKKLIFGEMLTGEGGGWTNDHRHGIHDLDKFKNA